MKAQKQKEWQPKERYGSSGAGFHGDRRTKRQRTRSAQKLQWKKEWQ